MADRYFVDTLIHSDRVALDGPEAHHLIHVMRIRPGGEIIVFDGSGAEFSATVSQVDRRKVCLNIGERREIDRELPGVVELGVALPKGDRGRQLIEKLTELGVTRAVPLVTQRSVARVDEKVLTRLRRGVVEASKQCGRNRLMEVTPPVGWDEYVASVTSPCRLVAHLDASAVPLASVTVADGADVTLAVGPEGGVTDKEADAAVASGWQLVDLGGRILRVETAGIVLAAWAAERVTES